MRNAFLYSLLSLCPLLLPAACRKAEQSAPLPVYTVEAAKPRLQDMDLYRSWVGMLEGQVSAEILPQISGYVSERCFVNGQSVKKGQKLYVIDSTKYEQALAQAREKEAQAAAEARQAQEDADYYAPLVKEGGISLQSYTDAAAHARSATAAWDAAKAALALAQTNVNYCTLSAPVDGVLGFAQADVGSYVSPDSAPLVLLMQLNPIRVYFSISEQEWLGTAGSGALSPGVELELLLANGKPYPLPARIVGVDNQVQSSTGSLRLDAEVANPDNLLRAGMYVTVRAKVGTLKNVYCVPQGAVLSLQGKTMLICLDAHNKAALLPVQTGPVQNGLIQVSGALTPDTRVIVSGTQQGMMAAENRAELHVLERD